MSIARRHFLHLAVGAAALPAVSRIATAQAYPVAANHDCRAVRGGRAAGRARAHFRRKG